MFALRVRKVIGHLDFLIDIPLDAPLQRKNLGEQSRSPCGLVENSVKRRILLAPTLWLVVDTIQHLGRLLQIAVSKARSCDAQCATFQGRAHLDEFFELSCRKGRDDCPATWSNVDKSFGFESKKSFANRNVAHPERSGDLILTQGVTRREPPAHDLVTQSLDDEIGG